ncbi:hypothetical protein ACFW17_03820 [Streptomyces sp. NPDC058961]|uniref:hypothetical protein n=1 Tax=unclassified Streptomyces TaxID=2593676 RepID=UPI0035D8F83D
MPVQRASAPGGRSLTSAPRAVVPSYQLDPVGVVRRPAAPAEPAPAPTPATATAPAPAPAPVEAAPPVQRKPMVRRVSRVQSAAAPEAGRRRPLIGAPITPAPAPAPAQTPAPSPFATPAPASAPAVQRSSAPEPAVPAAPPTPAVPSAPVEPLRKVRLPGPAPLQRALAAGPPLASARPLTTRHQSAPSLPGVPDSVAPGRSSAASPAPLKQAPASGDSRPVVPLRGPAPRPGIPQPTVQRAVAEPAPAPVVPVRRSSPMPAAPAPAPAPKPAYSAPVQRQADPASVQRTAPAAHATANAAPAADAEQHSPDIDALARRLVAPLSRLLRAELRGDRERIGRLRDR